MRVACLQLPGHHLTDPGERRAAAAQAAREVPLDTNLLVLPELWPVGFFRFDDYERYAEPLDGPTMQFAAGLARDRGCWVHGGSFVERSERGLHNTSVIVDPAGEVRATYRKTHLFGYRSREAEILTPGDQASVTSIAGMPTGAVTCYDLRFPELFRSLLDDGAELFLVTSAWPAARRDHWRLLCRARAVENQCWLIACNAAGTDDGVELAGHSMVVDPWGDIIAEADGEPGLLLAELDPARVSEIREKYPFLEGR